MRLNSPSFHTARVAHGPLQIEPRSDRQATGMSLACGIVHVLRSIQGITGHELRTNPNRGRRLDSGRRELKPLRGWHRK